ncbi:MAG: steroid-22-oyl-CoA synthetase [Acidimicrobiaceae bacterium]
MAARSIPAPGTAELPAANAAALLRRNGTDPSLATRPAVRFDDRVITHAEFLAESIRWANLFLAQPASTPDGVLHVGVLLDNTPEYLFALGGAALSRSVVVGLNHTRRDEHLWRDIEHTHIGLIVTESRHLPLLESIADRLPPMLVAEDDLAAALAGQSASDPGIEPDVSSRWALIFTSGTSSAPKAVICTQRRLLQTGTRMAAIMDLGPDDIGYVCMPLFHSNALMVGWAPSIVTGASVALARKFSTSSWLGDVRRHGATYFNYTGKPLSYLIATPEEPDDADNPLRVAFGNEGSPEVIETFGRRFGVEVIDAFGATEGGIAVNRDEGMKQGSVGKVGETVKVVDPDGTELPAARFDADGSLVNADRCVGEIVNTAGAGPFEGYYNNAEATESTLRGGWYWSGDLGYVDDDGFLFFAGRTADWLRVDGENFPAGPIEDAIGRHPDVVLAAVYGVPDEHAGDQVMVAVRLRTGATFDPAAFAASIDALPEVGPKWRPRYVRVVEEFPTTGTNKIVKRALVRQKYRRDLCGDDALYVRDRGADAYRVFTSDDEAALRAALERAGRIRFWDL